MRSQHNEEEYILRYLPPTGRFLEIGAYDGLFLSNTYCLLEKGWRGVMVEPSPEAFQKLRHNTSGFKNSVELVHCAISDTNDLTKFFECDEDNKDGIRSISTTVPAHVDMWNKINENVKFRQMYVATITMKNLLGKFGLDFDFVNIDVESANLMILKQLPVAEMNSLRMVCVEKDMQNQNSLYADCLPGFELVLETPPNLLYFRSEPPSQPRKKRTWFGIGR
jgi:FkbM family methyltransferase